MPTLNRRAASFPLVVVMQTLRLLRVRVLLQWHWLGGLVLRHIVLGLGSWIVRNLGSCR